jgi:hypothetical protein
VYLCQSVRLEQLGSQWAGFHEIWYLSVFRKICGDNSSFIKIWQEKRALYIIRTYIYDNIIAQFFFEWELLLPFSTPSDACGVDSLPSVVQFGEPEGLLSGYCTWDVLQSRDPLLRLSHTLGFLGPFIWLVFTLRFKTSIQIYSTVHSVSGARGGEVVQALSYKPEGRGIDSRWCQWNFSLA